jgi:hypothetical protein
MSALIFNILPEPIRDLVNWVDKNTFGLLFSLCFCVGAYAFIKFLDRRKGEATE